MRKYYRHFRRMEPWAKLTMWVERGYMKPPENYNLLKLYPQRQHAEDFPGYNKKVKLDPNNPMTKLRVQFLKKYPQYINRYKGVDYENDKLLETFIKKQFNLMKEGFSEVKAFDIVEKEFSTTLAAEKHDRLLFEGVNLNNRTRSLMDTFEQREEFIQRQKTKRLERDLPEFLRAEYYRNTAKEEINKSMVDKNTTNFNAADSLKNAVPYDPVMYYLSTNPNNDKNDEMKKENFIKRSENVLSYYHSYFEFSDGLSRSTTMDIQKFARETNQRFKNYFAFLVKKLEKNGVILNENGNIDFDKIESQGIKAFIKKNETICTVILLSKDLDFEVPHTTRISEIKRNILEEIEEEYKRLEELYTKKEESIREKPKKEVSSYEEIFKYASDFDTLNITQKRREKQSAKIKNILEYDDWYNSLSENEKAKNLFYKDLEYKKYFYTESLEDKEIRLKEIWLKKKKSILSSNVENKSENKDKFYDIKKEISNHIRSLRRQIDQYLIKNRKQAFFKNKIRFYDKEQVLYDAEINFHQIKRLLTFNSNILKNDPSIAKHYLDLMNAITRKKILENSIANFEKPEYFSKTEIPEVEEREADALYDIMYVDKFRTSEGEHKQEADNKELAKSEERKLLNSQVAEKKTKEKLLKYFEEHVKSSLGIKETIKEEPKVKGKSKIKQKAKESTEKSKGKSKTAKGKEVEEKVKFDPKAKSSSNVKTDSSLKQLKDKISKKVEKQS